MRSATYFAAALLAVTSTTSAQGIKGTAYGFASGVTGGGSAQAATPSSADELATWLSDDTARVILIDQEYDFTGTTGTGPGCDKSSCSANSGGQLYLGDLSCGNSDMVAVNSITYDLAGTAPLAVGSNKSILSSNGKGVLKGKGLSLAPGSSNVIIQGVQFTDINPKDVWGGDALELQGNNDGVWVDHCKFSLTGRMFVVNHYNPSRLTLSNNEFDGQTSSSATCNGNHYWTMMFYGDGDQVTLDRNYFHDVSGRAPKLGEPGVSVTFVSGPSPAFDTSPSITNQPQPPQQATNNYFSNMKGHAFDAYAGASALIEGNAFDSVDTPLTDQSLTVDTVFNVADASAAAACSSQLGRECVLNSLASSGTWTPMSSTSGLSAFSAAKDYLLTPIDASKVASLVLANAGPANLGSYTGYDGSGSSSSGGSGTGTGTGTSTGSGSGTSPSATATASASASAVHNAFAAAGPSGLPAGTGGSVPSYGAPPSDAGSSQLGSQTNSPGSSSGSSSSSSGCAGKRRRFRA